jgi:hypothetical protein
MNDFSELESQLKKLRPTQPSPEIFSRIESALREPAPPTEPADNVVHPNRFRINWVTVGLGLAAAATFLVLARIETAPPKQKPIASSSPARVQTPRPVDNMVPTGLTEVVYNTRDEGLRFAQNGGEPLRRVRAHKLETLQWRNPQTGASLRVSYPSEEISLIPNSGQ